MNEQRAQIYDNSNLAESYAGVVTPLTASFARDLYEGVYQNFCIFMGVSERDRVRHADIFPRMIVTIGYHLYYDIRNWYVLVSLLPGYAYNKGFFEHMLGIPAGSIVLASESAVPSAYARVAARIRLVYQILKIGAIFVCMPLWIRSFLKTFDREFAAFGRIELRRMSYNELVAHYRSVRMDLVRLWRVPIANDFAVMVSTGIARKLYATWVGDEEFAGSLRSASQAHLATLDPGKLLLRISEQVRMQGELQALLESDASPRAVYAQLRTLTDSEDLLRDVDEYLRLYGSRVPNELKLEAHTLHEAPEHIVLLLRSLTPGQVGKVSKRFAQDHAAYAVPPVQGVLRRGVLSFVLQWAQRSIRYREETRMRRTQIFGHARQTFLAIGTLLQRDGVLESASDVFFLTAAELCDVYAVPRKEVVERRKRELVLWKEVQMPTRIETTDDVERIEKSILTEHAKGGASSAPKVLRGMVASRAGLATVSGSALVLTEYDPHADYADRILITRHTDPGWTVVFPLVKAIVVERGGLLSHASIVARELNIPCIIGVVDATRHVRDGAEVVLDLQTGELRVVT